MREKPPSFEQEQNKLDESGLEAKDKTVLHEEMHDTPEIIEEETSPEVRMRMEIHRKMITEEHGKMRVFEKIKGGVAIALAGLSFAAAVPNWSYAQDKRQSQNTIETSKASVSPEVRKQAEKILQAHGIKMTNTGAGNIEYTGPGLDLARKIESQLASVAADLAFSMSKVERNYGLPESAPDMLKQVDALKKLLVSGEEADNALKPFFNGTSIFRGNLDLPRDRLMRVEEYLKRLKENPDTVEKIRRIKSNLDKLDQKDRQQSLGLELREQKLQKDLQNELKELSKKLIGGTTIATPEKNTITGSGTSPTSPSEIPVKTMERVGGELKQHGENIRKLNQQLEEELRKIQEKK